MDNALVIAFLCLTLAGLTTFGTWFARLKWGPGYYGCAIADDSALGLLGAERPPP